MSWTDASRGRTSPQEVRRKDFTDRVRGYDHREVRSFLAELGDDLERLHGQLATATQDNDRLRAELEEARAAPKDQATDQAVSVLNQAQQLADTLIDEAMQSARDLLLTARSQQRDVMEEAKVAAKGAVTRATAIAERSGSQDASVHDVEYIRMFAKVAQVHFQAVLDALDDQLHRLGEVDIAKPPKFD